MSNNNQFLHSEEEHPVPFTISHGDNRSWLWLGILLLLLGAFVVLCGQGYKFHKRAIANHSIRKEVKAFYTSHPLIVDGKAAEFIETPASYTGYYFELYKLPAFNVSEEILKIEESNRLFQEIQEVCQGKASDQVCATCQNYLQKTGALRKKMHLLLQSTAIHADASAELRITVFCSELKGL